QAGHNLQFANPGGIGEVFDGVNLRRGRVFLEGTAWEVMDFKFELEFFNGFRAVDRRQNSNQFDPAVFNSPGPTDAWIRFKELPVIGNVPIGSQKEPWSLEHLEFYRSLPFLERSFQFDGMPQTGFNNGFTPGILVYNTYLNERGTWWVGLFKNDTSL